ncbi:MAG: RES family NAD+ phosphorylase [Geminicoccaceae bacterium]
MASRFEGSFQVFRIASAVYPIFDGGGAHRWGSRWCTPGRRVIHTASAYSLALLENLVHWNAARLPPDMRYVVATIPEQVSRAVLDSEALPAWDRPDYGISRRFGDAWYDEGAAAVLVVPSALSPFEPNVLINQNHPDTGHVQVSSERPAVLDRRLAR